MTEAPGPNDLERRLANLRAVAAHEAQTPPPRSGPGWRSRLRTFGPIGIALAFVLGKFKLIVPVLKFAKFGTLLSMVVAVWAYALFWGLPFAFGFVMLIFVHELGHAVVMRHLGIHAGAPVFIPFLGAVIAMKSTPKDAYIEALVGIGGPILGSVGALACLIVAGITGSGFWYALASTGFLINLFNLLPISPLDGGRIVGVISRWIWVVGYAAGIAMFFATQSPVLFLILVLGLFRLTATIRGPHATYYQVSSQKRWAIGIAYFGLVIALSFGLRTAQAPLEGFGTPQGSSSESFEVDSL